MGKGVVAASAKSAMTNISNMACAKRHDHDMTGARCVTEVRSSRGAGGDGAELRFGVAVGAVRPGVEPITHGAWVGGAACGDHVDAAANGTAVRSEVCDDGGGVAVWPGDVVGDEVGAAGNGVALCSGG
eukprot:gene3988-14689_t